MTNEETIENLMTIKNIYTWSSGADEALDIAIQILKATQSVSEKCKDCVEFTECADLLNMPLGHSCEDCISRKALLDYIDKMPSELTSDGRRMVRRRTLEEYISDTLPSVTPQPKVGRWEISTTETLDGQGLFECTICGYLVFTRIGNHYCPNCGAKMGEIE